MESLLLSEEDSSGEEAKQCRELWNPCCSLRRTLVVKGLARPGAIEFLLLKRTLVVKKLGRAGSHGILAAL